MIVFSCDQKLYSLLCWSVSRSAHMNFACVDACTYAVAAIANAYLFSPRT